MSRRLLGALILSVGVLLGCVLDRYVRTSSAQAAPDDAATQEQPADLASQINDIRGQVKDINTLLHSGTIKVIVVLNPDK